PLPVGAGCCCCCFFLTVAISRRIGRLPGNLPRPGLLLLLLFMGMVLGVGIVWAGAVLWRQSEMLFFLVCRRCLLVVLSVRIEFQLFLFFRELKWRSLVHHRDLALKYVLLLLAAIPWSHVYESHHHRCFPPPSQPSAPL